MEPDASLAVRNLSSGYDGKVIIPRLDLQVPPHKVSVIIGGNGSGKSTLLKTLARLIRPMDGEVLVDGKLIGSIPTRQLARQLGLLPQSPLAPDGVTVSDLVARGRFPYRSMLGGMGAEDLEAVAEAMQVMGIVDLADRPVDALSGGQRQRVWIAMALAQRTGILLLDEPTTYLDIAYQIEILDLLDELNRRRGTTVVMVLHDINLSSRYADHIFAMQRGRLVRGGTPREVVTVETMREIFDLDCVIIDDPVSGSPFVVPKGRAGARGAGATRKAREAMKVRGGAWETAEAGETRGGAREAGEDQVAVVAAATPSGQKTGQALQ